MRMKDDFYYQYKEELKENLFSLFFNQENFPRTELVLPTIYEFVNDCVAEGYIKASIHYAWDFNNMSIVINGRRNIIYMTNDHIYVNYKEFSFLGFINFIMDALK